jgi:asparagine synthase (glutamine-hydrolysing)
MDHRLVEWLATLPSSLKFRGGEGKWFFKRALEAHLPRDVLYRSKMGFSVPLASWMRGPLRERVKRAVLGADLADTRLFNPAYLKRLVDEHLSGAYDHSSPLWSLLMFEGFLRQVIGRPESTDRDERLQRIA